jgi:hypothetical protein
MPTHPSHLQPDGDPDGTTRTRLPEGDPSARRPPVRTSRPLVSVVGVVVLLIAALAFATRGGSGSGSANSSGAGTNTGTGTAAKLPEAAATAPTGQRPVTTQTAGITSGFPQTPEGAQSAAANYAVALGSDGMFNTERRHQIIATVYAPAVLASNQSTFDQAYSAGFLKRIGLNPAGSPPSGMTFVSRINPVGTKLDALTGTTAKVEVWYSALFGLAGNGSINPVSNSWYTNTFDLTWADDDWKVSDYSQKDGPTPIGQDQTASSAQDITNAVKGFGGFTYAR